MTKKKDIFYGRQPAIEMLKSDRPVDKILMQRGLGGDDLKEIESICREQGIPVQFVPKEKINYLLYPIFHGADVNHQGVVGFYGAIQYYKLDDILHQVVSSGQDALFIVLDGVTDIRNIGAIARSASALGAHAIVIPQKGSASISADAVKASAGALNNLPVCREKDLFGAIEMLKLNGIAIVGSSLRGKSSLKEIDFAKPVALVLGSEGYGMSKEIERKCDERFIIPMTGNTESLNVGVSAGIMLYEAFSQRNK